MAPPSKPLAAWTVAEVEAWAQEAFPSISDKLVGKKLAGRHLLRLDDRWLEKLGIDEVVTQMDVLDAVEELKMTHGESADANKAEADAVAQVNAGQKQPSDEANSTSTSKGAGFVPAPVLVTASGTVTDGREESPEDFANTLQFLKAEKARLDARVRVKETLGAEESARRSKRSSMVVQQEAAKQDDYNPKVLEVSQLLSSARWGHQHVLRVVLDSGEHDVHERDHKGRSAVFLAARFGHPECVQLLLDSKADPTVASKKGQFPLDVAKDDAIVEMLTKAIEALGKKPADFRKTKKSVGFSGGGSDDDDDDGKGKSSKKAAKKAASDSDSDDGVKFAVGEDAPDAEKKDPSSPRQKRILSRKQTGLAPRRKDGDDSDSDASDDSDLDEEEKAQLRRRQSKKVSKKAQSDLKAQAKARKQAAGGKAEATGSFAGMVQKCSRYGNWSKRWISYKNGELSYARNAGDALQPVAHLSQVKCLYKNVDAHAGELYTWAIEVKLKGEERTYYFKCDNEEQRTTWTEALSSDLNRFADSQQLQGRLKVGRVLKRKDKRSASRWKTRWMMLTPTRLTYHESHDLDAAPLGGFDLFTLNVSRQTKSKANTLLLKTVDGRGYTIQCGSVELAEEWFEAIAGAKDALFAKASTPAGKLVKEEGRARRGSVEAPF